MKVGIDTLLCDHGRSGAGSYLLSLVRSLPAADDIQFELFGSEFDRFTFAPGGGPLTYAGFSIPDTGKAQQFWHFFRMKSFVQKQKYDVVLVPAANRYLPLTLGVPYVVVVHDIFSKELQGKSRLKRTLLLRSLRNAKKIIAGSQYIRKNLISLKIDADKIEVIHSGIDHSHFYQHTEFEGETVLIKPFSIKRPFIIYASRLQHAEKKHVELIQAFSLFKKKTGLPHRLVLAGEAGAMTDAVQKAASESEYATDILMTGYFPHENLPELYSCADACIFPSVAEGVGLPVIEAMATGLVVACAKAGALTEVAGDSALYFNSDDIEDMASVIETVVTDEKIREKLVESGFKRTKRFSWEKTASQTVDVLKSANLGNATVTQ